MKLQMHIILGRTTFCDCGAFFTHSRECVTIDVSLFADLIQAKAG